MREGKRLKRKVLILFTVLVLAGSLFCISSSNVNAADNTGPLEADFTWSPENPSTSQLITFDASSTSSSAPIEEYAWNFDEDDDDDDWGEKPDYAYAKSGTYEVKLWVRDANNNTDIVRKEINVKEGSGGGAPSPEEGFFSFFDFLPFFGIAFGLAIILPIILLLISILIAIWVYKDAESRGESGVLWLLVVLITNLIGLIVWLVVRPEKKEARSRRENKPKTGTKYCTNCGSENKADAKYCNECGKEL